MLHDQHTSLQRLALHLGNGLDAAGNASWMLLGFFLQCTTWEAKAVGRALHGEAIDKLELPLLAGDVDWVRKSKGQDSG